MTPGRIVLIALGTTLLAAGTSMAVAGLIFLAVVPDGSLSKEVSKAAILGMWVATAGGFTLKFSWKR